MYVLIRSSYVYNKQTLNERFEDYNEPTEQEEIWSDEIIGEEEL